MSEMKVARKSWNLTLAHAVPRRIFAKSRVKWSGRTAVPDDVQNTYWDERGCRSNNSTVWVVNGTIRRDEAVFGTPSKTVPGPCTICRLTSMRRLAKSMSVQRSPQISPRRSPVRIANRTMSESRALGALASKSEISSAATTCFVTVGMLGYRTRWAGLSVLSSSSTARCRTIERKEPRRRSEDGLYAER